MRGALSFPSFFRFSCSSPRVRFSRDPFLHAAVTDGDGVIGMADMLLMLSDFGAE